MTSAQNYTAVATTADGVDIVRLSDARTHTTVSIVPSVGNTAYEMKVNGQDIFWSPFKSVAQFKARPILLGVPFLSPWANRLDQEALWANGQKYKLNAELKNLGRDGNNLPIHGLLGKAAWTVKATGSDDQSAWVTSRLEFWREPKWMAQFPFAHAIEMTYRLHDGVLEIHTRYENHSTEPMPLVIGYHPYFTMGAPRDEWQVHLAAREHVKLSNLLVPTGEREPIAQTDLSLKGTQLDDVYTNLVRDGATAEFSVAAAGKKISVIYGPKYPVAVVYAPPGRNLICFEPMTGITNGANLAHEGKYDELQSIAAGGTWEESFWVKPSGY